MATAALTTIVLIIASHHDMIGDFFVIPSITREMSAIWWFLTLLVPNVASIERQVSMQSPFGLVHIHTYIYKYLCMYRGV